MKNASEGGESAHASGDNKYEPRGKQRRLHDTSWLKSSLFNSLVWACILVMSVAKRHDYSCRKDTYHGQHRERISHRSINNNIKTKTRTEWEPNRSCILAKINKIHTRNISTNYFSISTRSSVNYIPDVIEVMIIKHIKIMWYEHIWFYWYTCFGIHNYSETIGIL